MSEHISPALQAEFDSRTDPIPRHPRKVYVDFYDRLKTPSWYVLRGSVGDLLILARNENEQAEHWTYINTREIRSMR